MEKEVRVAQRTIVTLPLEHDAEAIATDVRHRLLESRAAGESEDGGRGEGGQDENESEDVSSS